MGLFIVIEGVDYSGKTTIIKKIEKELQEKNLKVYKTFEPGGTKLGNLLRNKIILNHNYEIDEKIQILLFLISRYQHLNKIIIPNLKKYDVILCDRYFYSTFVYQGLYHKKANWNLIFKLHETLGIFKTLPDFVIFIKEKPEILIERKKKYWSLKWWWKMNHYDKRGKNQAYFQKMNKLYEETFKKLQITENKLIKIEPGTEINKIVTKIIKNVKHKNK